MSGYKKRPVKSGPFSTIPLEVSLISHFYNLLYIFGFEVLVFSQA